MKYAILAATAVAAFAVVTPASAVNLSGVVLINPTTLSGTFDATHGGLSNIIPEPNGTTFTDTFRFTTLANMSAAAAVIEISIDSANFLNLTGLTLNGTAATFSSSTNGGMTVYTSSVMANTNTALLGNTITVSGSVVGGGGSYSGNVKLRTLGAVPEPATWGLMVLGFGAVGGALRTSRRKVVFA